MLTVFLWVTVRAPDMPRKHVGSLQGSQFSVVLELWSVADNDSIRPLYAVAKGTKPLEAFETGWSLIVKHKLDRLDGYTVLRFDVFRYRLVKPLLKFGIQSQNLEKQDRVGVIEARVHLALDVSVIVCPAHLAREGGRVAFLKHNS